MAKEKLSRLQEAVKWASKLHRGQDRDGPAALPYLTHPLEVLCNLRYKGGVTDEDMLVASVLHDVVEECGVEPEEIGRRFGPRVRELVSEVTRAEPSASEIAGMSADEVWQLRADRLLDEIKGMGPEARTLKLADRLSNVGACLKLREGKKRDRYVRQSFLILEVIPRETNPELWDAVREALSGG